MYFAGQKSVHGLKTRARTFYDVLMEIYVEYGFSKETTVNVVKPGKSGADEIKAMMENLHIILRKKSVARESFWLKITNH